jgi:hypothetical protein
VRPPTSSFTEFQEYIDMGLFITQWSTILLGFLIHAAAVRNPQRRTAARLVELALLWFVAGGGFWSVFGGLFHIGPTSAQIAQDIGYTQSMFQWEVGWADIAMGVLGLACIRPRLRGTWMNAAVAVVFIAFWGDGVGHIITLATQGNTAPDNIWSMPTDFLLPLIAAVLLVIHRRQQAQSTAWVGWARPARASVLR